MIRVGFRLLGGTAWQGGRTYLWNLLHAVTALPERRVQPVLLVPPGQDLGDLALPGVERHDTDRFDPALQPAGRLLKLVLGRNLIERRRLRDARVDVLSHAAPVGAGIPTIAWIPDLQQLHLPHMFRRRERLLVELSIREIVRDATLVVTSSESARDDMERHYGAGARCRVLRFVSQPRLTEDKMIAHGELCARHAIPERYIHLPNQLWKHKNHTLVVEALRRAPEVVVVATGPREDFRHPGMWEQLQAQIRRHGLEDRFRHLGLVSFPELISLMRHAVAIVNPSRFEGWSTTVEEAKSLGKRVLVSDIPVHREQAPARASYFPVDDPETLAEQMIAAWTTHDLGEDARAAATAAAALPERTRAFGERYQAIVLEAVR